MSYDAYSTRALLSAVSASPPAFAYVGEVDAVYTYNSGSSALADGWVTLTSSAGGRYILNSQYLVLPRAGGTTDDWPNFLAACKSLAAVGKKLQFGPGTYNYKSAQAILFNNAWIELSPLTEIVCNCTTPANNLNAPFTFEGAWSASDVTATAANVGDMTLTVAGSMTPVVGGYIAVYDREYRGGHYKVKAWNAGTKTATLDRPLRQPSGSPIATTSFPSGSEIHTTTIVENARVDFNGAKIHGTCVRFIELILTRKCNIYGPVYCGDGTTTTASDRIISLDETSFDCHAHQIYGDGGNVTTLGTSFESAEACSYTRCEMTQMTNVAHTFQDAVDCTLNEQFNHNSSGGVVFTAAADNSPPTGAGSVWGSQHCRINGGSYSKNGTGIIFERGSSFCTVDGASVLFNTNGIDESNTPAAEPAPGYYNKAIGNTMLRLNIGNAVHLSLDSNYFVLDASNVTNNQNGISAEASSVWPTVSLTRFDQNNGIAVLAASNMNLHASGGLAPAANTNVMIFQSSAATVMEASMVDFQSSNATNPAALFKGVFNMPLGRIHTATNGTTLYGAAGSTMFIGMAATAFGAGTSGANIALETGATAYVAQGAIVPNYSMRSTSTPANNVPMLNSFLGFTTLTG